MLVLNLCMQKSVFKTHSDVGKNLGFSLHFVSLVPKLLVYKSFIMKTFTKTMREHTHIHYIYTCQTNRSEIYSSIHCFCSICELPKASFFVSTC